MDNAYQEFLKTKVKGVKQSGFSVDANDLHPRLFDYQRAIVQWALALGKAAIWADVGLGKTLMQLDWAQMVAEHTQKPVILFAPLGVAFQTIELGAEFGYELHYLEDENSPIESLLSISNYERMDKFNMSKFSGVVLDESSAIKAYSSKRYGVAIDQCRDIPYKLLCSATPAPNDYMEIGNQLNFLDVMDNQQMLQNFFTRTNQKEKKKGNTYRLKKHADSLSVGGFWWFLSRVAVCIRHPRDLGDEYDMDGFDLPPLNIISDFVEASDDAYEKANANGMLFPDTAPSATQLGAAKRLSLESRLEKVQEIVANIDQNEPILIWCHLNKEAEELKRLFPDAVNVQGNQSVKQKVDGLLGFSKGEFRILITKPKIAGMGMNWQHCANVIYFSPTFSFQDLFQSRGRTHRYGQTRPVNFHIIHSETEGNVMARLARKEKDYRNMQSKMAEATRKFGLYTDSAEWAQNIKTAKDTQGHNWMLMLGDCVQRLQEIPDNLFGLGLHSPPFESLFVYSDDPQDLSNSETSDEFFEHYAYVIKELYRTTQAGRLTFVHCQNLPTFKGRDGVSGLRDFRGDIIRAFIAEGWTFHTEIMLWRNPAMQMQRTKSPVLLHKNFAGNTGVVRQGTPEFMIGFRKPPNEDDVKIETVIEIGDYIGTEPPAPKDYETMHGKPARYAYSIATWEKYASPSWLDLHPDQLLGGDIWTDIDDGDVLDYRKTKGDKDERHITPTNLQALSRIIQMYSNKGDSVFDPFAGIGSVGYAALLLRRKYVGIELKDNYHQWGTKFLKSAEIQMDSPTLFDLSDYEVDSH